MKPPAILQTATIFVGSVSALLSAQCADKFRKLTEPARSIEAAFSFLPRAKEPEIMESFMSCPPAASSNRATASPPDLSLQSVFNERETVRQGRPFLCHGLSFRLTLRDGSAALLLRAPLQKLRLPFPYVF